MNLFAASMAIRLLIGVSLLSAWHLAKAAEDGLPKLQATVELEEEVYSFEDADNGAGPMWCSGSTCLVRIGEDVFASGLETLKGIKPLNNCRWLLFKRESNGWKLEQKDPKDRTREPCPMVGFPDGRLFLSVNPTLASTNTYAGPAQPQLLQFTAKDLQAPWKTLLPVWEGNPAFSEHSYRSFAADGPNRELILFQNIGYTHAEWTFLDRMGNWAAQGKLAWPQGREYAKPEPIRVCYPDVVLKNRAVYFCGVSDIVEPNPEWRAFKKQLTGREWDYDFRRLFYTWTPDITREKFHDWVEIASREQTCGWISPGDLWVGRDGAAHIVWTERAIDERLRAKFFPEAKQSHSLNYAVVRNGAVVLRRTLLLAEEGKSGLVASAARFQVFPNNRLFLVFYVHGTENGQAVSENRVMEIGPDGETGNVVKLAFKKPFTSYFTATPRGGSPESETLELLGTRAGMPASIGYARVRLR